VSPSAYSDSSEAAHLRALLEKQPSCLLRVGRDGLLLACNDAGLSLLGKNHLGDVLNQRFEEHLAPNQVDTWREFADRVWATGAGSIECELASGTSGIRTVQLQAIALRDHPDQIESLLISVRDTSPLRRLEESLQADAQAQGKLDALEAQLAAARADHQQLAATLAAREAERDRADQARRQAEALLEIERAAAQKLTETEQQLAAARRDYEAVTLELAASQAEQRRLAAAMLDRDADRDRIADEHRRELIRLQQLAEHHQLIALEKERGGRERVSVLERQLASAVAEQQRLLALVAEHQTTGDQAQTFVREREQQMAVLEAELARVRSEEQRLAHTVEALVRERGESAAAQENREAELRAELERARAHAAAQREEDQRLLAELHAQVVEAVAGQQHATALAEDLDARLRKSSADHEAARADMERALADAREQTRSAAEASLQDALSRAREAAASEAGEAALRIGALEADLQRVSAELDSTRAALDEVGEQSQGTVAALERVLAAERISAAAAADRAAELESRLEQMAAEREQLRRELERAVHEAREQGESARGALQTTFDRHREAAAAAAEQAAKRIEQLENQLRQAIADRDGARIEMELALAAAREEARSASEAALQQTLAARDHAAAEVQQLQAAAAADAERTAGVIADLKSKVAEAEAAAKQTKHKADERDRRALESLRAEHAEVLADRARVGELVEELAAELRRVASEHDAARAQLERTLAETRAEATRQHDRDRLALAEAEHRYSDAVAEQGRLLEAIAREQTERRRLEADRAAIRADFERQMAEEHERALSAHDRQRSELVANLQAELALANADQKRLQMLLARAESDQQRQSATHAADRAAMERALGEATLRRSEMAKLLADERVELKQWRDAACELEPMAATGRLAVQLSRELHDVITALDDRTRLLLDVSRLDAGYRPLIEALRADAMRSMMLARRLSQPVAGGTGSEDAH
jgi:hypothetical protein